MRRRKRLPGGGFGELEKIGSVLTTEEQVDALGMQLAQEKFASMQKDVLVNGLGAQVAQMKLEIMALKGGGA
ncbi:XkdW family protein [Solibacillus sp. FSL K6-1523]|uniref:XkdW family protein n=1 Tax=Solibacillus sp. FSL K6-1523 TaxID=2921471 RepID=UPI0030F9B966